jgi:hypothetical protein
MDAAKMNSEIKNLVVPLMGLRCCRKQANKNGGLSLGFGARIPHGKSRLKNTFYGEWEIGSFYGSWRIGKGGNILCASQDIWKDQSGLDDQLNGLELDQIISLDQLTELDVRAGFSNGTFADFLATTSDDDELFHIFCPRNIYVEFCRDGIWRIGESNKPWPEVQRGRG